MNNELKNLGKLCKKYIAGMIKSLTDNLEQKHVIHQQNMYQLQKQNLDNLVLRHMTQIKTELYDVLSTNSYSRFSITHPNNIRIINYSYRQGRWIYYFSIPLHRDNLSAPISRSVLDVIKEKISKDIEAFKRDLFIRFPAPAQQYPAISTGIYIENIKHIGDELYLEISTAVKPF